MDHVSLVGTYQTFNLSLIGYKFAPISKIGSRIHIGIVYPGIFIKDYDKILDARIKAKPLNFGQENFGSISQYLIHDFWTKIVKNGQSALACVHRCT